MVKKLLCTGLISCASFLCVAQVGTISKMPDRFSHHVGIQVNPLLRQLVNFGSSADIDNPFLLKYGLRFNASQTELLFGFGYRYALVNEENGLKSDLSDLSFRVGYAKKFRLGRGFEAGVGIDAVLNLQNNQTINVQSFGPGFVDSTITTTQSTQYAFGGGPQVTFGYYLTENIRIGTEATFYFLTGANDLTVRTENWREDFTGNINYSSSSEKNKDRVSNLDLQIPVALFLTIVF